MALNVIKSDEMGRRTRQLDPDFAALAAFDGMLRTHKIWRETGLL